MSKCPRCGGMLRAGVCGPCADTDEFDTEINGFLSERSPAQRLIRELEVEHEEQWEQELYELPGEQAQPTAYEGPQVMAPCHGGGCGHRWRAAA